MTRKKQINSKIKSEKTSYNSQYSYKKSIKHQDIVSVNDNVQKPVSAMYIQNIIQSRIDVKNTNLLAIFIMSENLLKAGLIVEDEYRMLVNDHNIDKKQHQNFIDLWAMRKERLCHCKASEEEITKTHEIISILRFVDIFR
jgi:hypothetical protein